MPVTTALVGCGPRGMDWLGPALKESDHFDLTAVCDVDPQRLAAASEKFGAPGEADLERLLRRDDLQSVVVATSARYHVPVALAAVRAGKHVFVEKPLADAPAAGRQLAQEAERAGVVGVVGYQFRVTPFAAALAEELPHIRPVQALLTAHRVPLMRQFFFPDHYGGIMDDTTHTVHLALWAMGGRPEGVMAHVRRGTITGDETIEFASILIDFDDRSRCAFIQSSMFGATRAPNLVEFIGTHGVVSTTDRRTLRVARHAGIREPGPRAPEGLDERTVETPQTGYQQDTIALLEHFADLVAGRADRRRPRACTLTQGADTIAVMAAMVRSFEEGRRVTLAELE